MTQLVVETAYDFNLMSNTPPSTVKKLIKTCYKNRCYCKQGQKFKQEIQKKKM